jgi:hypothetical protein
MTRTIALRSSALFVLSALVFGLIALGGSHAWVAQAVFLVTGAICAVMLIFALAAPVPRPVPVRIRR